MNVHRLIARFLVGVALVLAGASGAEAGGGPENLFLVVNSASWASKTVANHYIQLRGIPGSHVLFLEWRGELDGIDIATFRQRILGPVLMTIQQRGLADQIDYVVYSSDFPTAIGIGAEIGDQKLPEVLMPTCAINALTFHWQRVMTRSAAVLGAQTNHYTVHANRESPGEHTHGFRSWYGWSADGQLLEAGGEQYLLSTMLAVTSGRGNSVGEAIRYLQRSAGVDGKRPKGTIYYCRNSGIRATTREPRFATAVAALKKLGVNAKIVEGDLPSNRPDVLGAMLGVARFSWPNSSSTILPGAICENLTSYGGILREGASQTPLTELLRYGAAGSSGTVVEPGAVQQKFPLPSMHVHYARGCSLAEAFYQSVYAPFQLLIVGDPLCQPFADVPKIRVEGIAAGQEVRGRIEVKPLAESDQGAPVDRWELFVDGRQNGRGSAGQTLTLDTTTLADGYHALTLVGIRSGPIETQGRMKLPIVAANRGHKVTLAASHKKVVRWDETLTLEASCPGCEQIIFASAGRPLASAAGPSARVQIDPRQLGSGPVDIYAVASWRKAKTQEAVSPPLSLVVRSAKPIPALAETAGRRLRGMLLRIDNGEPIPIQETRPPKWLADAGVKAGTSFTLEGFFTVPADDVYQFQIAHDGSLRLAVDDSVLYGAASTTPDERQFLPVSLRAGLHRIHVSGKAGPQARLMLTFGGQGTTSFEGTTFRQPAE